jgi:hypothetical protein
VGSCTFYDDPFYIFGSASLGKGFKIGGCWPMTGAGAVWGLALGRGMELGCEDINKSGGIAFEGKKHKVIWEGLAPMGYWYVQCFKAACGVY